MARKMVAQASIVLALVLRTGGTIAFDVNAEGQTRRIVRTHPSTDSSGNIALDVRAKGTIQRHRPSVAIALEENKIPKPNTVPIVKDAESTLSAYPILSFPGKSSSAGRNSANSSAGNNSAAEKPTSSPISTRHQPSKAITGRRVEGLILILLSMCLASAGFAMQRKAHLLGEQESRDGDHVFLASGGRLIRPLWLLGVTLYTLAALPDVVAYTLIPQVLCSSVACLRVVMVSVLGHFFLGDRLQRHEVTGIAICTSGALLCVWFGPGGETMPGDPGDFHRQKVARYVAAGLCLLAVLLIVVHAGGSSGPRSRTHSFALPLATAVAYGLEKVFNSELAYVPMPANIMHEPWKILHAPVWLSLVGAVVAFGLLDFYLNLRAAKYMPLHVFVPLSFACGTLVQNFQGLVILNECVDMNLKRSVFTCLGAGLALAGALMIQPAQFGVISYVVDKSKDEETDASWNRGSHPRRNDGLLDIKKCQLEHQSFPPLSAEKETPQD